MIKTALTAALVFVSASAALATDFDPNLENRYPGARAFQGSNVSMTGSQTIVRTPAIQAPMFDRASNPSAGGGY